MRQDEQSETFDQDQLFSSPYPFHCFDMVWCLTWPSFQVFWCRQGWQHRGGEQRRQRWCSWRSRRQGQSVLWSQMGLRRGPSWTCLPRPKKGKVNGQKLCFLLVEHSPVMLWEGVHNVQDGRRAGSGSSRRKQPRMYLTKFWIKFWVMFQMIFWLVRLIELCFSWSCLQVESKGRCILTIFEQAWSQSPLKEPLLLSKK